MPFGQLQKSIRAPRRRERRGSPRNAKSRIDNSLVFLLRSRSFSALLGALGVLALAFLFASTAYAQPKIVTASQSHLRIVETRHYEIHTDLDDELVDDLGRRMDAMYEEYVRRLSEFQPPREQAALPVYLFQHRADYMAVTLYRGANTGGMFVAGRDRTFLASYLEGQGRDGLRRVLQHEAFHQFAFFAISRQMPIWLNEGLAQLFEEGIWNGKSFQIGQIPPRRVRQLQADYRSRSIVAFRTFLAVSPTDWSANLNASADRGTTYYNQAWAMVQFLSMTNPLYEQHLVLLLHDLHQGMDSTSAFKLAFGDNIEGFQLRFDEWAHVVKATPAATLLERQDTLGDLLVAVTAQGQRFDELSQFRSAVVSHGYRLHYTRGNVQWTTENSPQVYFSDLQGRLYGPQQLYFEPSSEGGLPDIVCKPEGHTALRTHFYQGVDRIEHEVLVEAAR